MSQPSDLTSDDVRGWISHAHGTPQYHHLTELVASDSELLRIINRIEHTPKTNLLFAGVQYLMHREPGSELAGFYPNFTNDPRPIEEVDDVFKAFVVDHEAQLVEIGRTRYTQTNECRRCVALLPAIWESGFDRFHLIDVGSSAGLNLALDRYRYRWGDVKWGPESIVALETELRRGTLSPRDIEILTRTGLDLHPIDPLDPDDRIWLESLVWPENDARRRRLAAALDVAATQPIELVAGDAVTTLDGVLSGLSDMEPVVVMNSFALNQFTPEMRDELEAIVDRHRSTRSIHRVWLEIFASDNEWAQLRVDSGAGYRDFGQGHAHGEWFEFYV